MDIFSVSKSAWTSSQFLRVHGHLLNFYWCQGRYLQAIMLPAQIRHPQCSNLCWICYTCWPRCHGFRTVPYVTLHHLSSIPRNVALAVLLSVLAGSVIHLYVKKWLCCFSVNNTISLSQWSVSYPLPTLYEKEVAQKLHGVMFHSREEGNVSAPYPLSQWSVS